MFTTLRRKKERRGNNNNNKKKKLQFKLHQKPFYKSVNGQTATNQQKPNILYAGQSKEGQPKEIQPESTWIKEVDKTIKINGAE